MPALEMAQDSGKLIKWLKQEGQSVSQGEPLMEIQTDKVTVEIESPASGKLASVSAAPGDEVPVGQVIALILEPGEDLSGFLEPERSVQSTTSEDLSGFPEPERSGDPATSAQPAIPATPVAARAAAEHGVDLAMIEPAGGRIEKADVLAYVRKRSAQEDGGYRLSPASPKARRLARKNAVDIGALHGSGPGGAVLAADVTAALQTAGQPAHETPPVEPAPEAPPLSNVWRVMAERVTRSWTTAPHFYLLREVDASRLIAWREHAQGRSVAKITYTDLLVKVTAAALQRRPQANARWDEEGIVFNEAINIGLAVAVDDGLIVPVLHRAVELSLEQIAARREDLVARAQAGQLKPEDLRDGTFTISNLGMYGVDAFSAVINPPQAAILAVGRIADRVVPIDGQPAVRPMMILSLSCDHRVIDGARAAQFLQTLAALLEEPLGLL
ncbi:MAG TPA: dihydrolipoamide acetyltransferase family protein [Xanthomonadales bacterium]|nr:dihydrolipoamide acetyltransferase family protein [Xanthomonadales bacterium]